MQRISILLPSLRGGGAERVMLTIATELAERGHEVDLVLCKAEGAYINDVPASVNLIDLRNHRLSRCLVPLLKHIRRRQPEALLSTMRHVNLLAVTAKLMSPHSFRLIVREANTIGTQLMEDNNLKERCMPFLMKWLYPRADAIVAVSEDTRKDLITHAGIDPYRVQIIHNPVVSDLMFKHAESAVTHPWLKSHTVPVIVAAGRLCRQKDFPTLIDAFAKLRQHLVARLIILGEGEERANLMQQARALGIAEHVDLPGFVNNPFCYMKQADLFVLSSLWEGLPNTLIQAMALGTPVISTDCSGGSREILNNGTLGELVPTRSSDRLSIVMRNVIQSRFSPTTTLRNKRAMAHCAGTFGLRPIVDQYQILVSTLSLSTP
ncbi:glycosyltransferase [Ketobacter sp.]|uniref:glycosyltransferase n=2 Tax=unclassified Ketobacter TaxID=2639109 RepID=UPI0025C21D4A|nr:glycosyltransferase [Ketobacter sp.]